MKLKEYGLKIVKRPISNFLPIDNTTYLKLGGGLEKTQEEFRKFSKKDAARLPEYYARIEAVADVLRDLSVKTPPNPKQGIKAALSAALQLWPIATKEIKYTEMYMISLQKALDHFLIHGLKMSI